MAPVIIEHMRIKIIHALVAAALLCFAAFDVSAQDVICVTDYGAEPGSRNDVCPSVRMALEAARGRDNVVIKFPKGRYDFYPEFSGTSRPTGIDIFKHSNLTIDGDGSEFVFHGMMQVAKVDSSSNVTFSNFSVDWDRPLMSQAEIVKAEGSYLDVKIDREKYPYVIRDRKIRFIGEGWEFGIDTVYSNLYRPDTKEIVYNTWDHPLGHITDEDVEQLPGGVVRFHGKVRTDVKPGLIVPFYHKRYAVVGFRFQNSKDLFLKDITVYHVQSHGLLGERCENITMDNFNMTANEAKGRVFSIVADASHFINCKGVITVRNCCHTGQGDDFINVHGRNARIVKVLDPKTVETMKDGRYTTPGDTLWLISHATAQREYERIVEDIAFEYDERGRVSACRMTFTEPLPPEVDNTWFTENKTWSAGLVMQNCRILKRHRARGILFTTPKPVVIENCYFNTAGTAILIEGDMDYWFESGANTDVLIRNNIFDNCLTSGCKTGDRWEWGDAVITITPSHRPQSSGAPAYHRNIRIEDNEFRVFDVPLVRARSVDGLRFTCNQIVRTYDYKPYTWFRDSFVLDGCRNVIIRDNALDEEYRTRTIWTEHMKRSDVRSRGFEVKIN